MSDATTVDMSLQQSCDAAMLHANVEVKLLIDKANRLEAENAKLRELARLLLWSIDNDMPRDEELVWSQKVDALVSELGVEP